MTLQKNKNVLVIAAAALLLLVLPVLNLPAEAANYEAQEQQILELINQSRTEKGIAPLQVDSTLTAAAREQAEEFAGISWGSYEPLYKLLNSGDYEGVRTSVLRTSNPENAVKYQLSRYSGFAGLSDQYNAAGIGIVDSSRYGSVCVELFAKSKSVPETPQQPEAQQPAENDQAQQPEAQQPAENNQSQQPEAQQPAENNQSQQPEAQQPAESNQSQQPAESTADNNTASMSEFQSQIVQLVNEERAKAGLQPLTVKADLNKVAQLKAEDMAENNYFSHTSPTYGSPFDMMKQFGITYTRAGENIAMGYRTPESVMEGWMNSAGHKANILNENFTEIGVGFTADGYYWVQHFARR